MEIKAECETLQFHYKKAELSRAKAAELYFDLIEDDMDLEEGFDPDFLDNLNDYLRL